MKKAEKRKTGKPGEVPSLLGDFIRLEDGKGELARDNEERDIFRKVYDLLLSGEIKKHVSIAMKEKLSEESFHPFTDKEHFTRVVNDLFDFKLMEFNVKDYLGAKKKPEADDCWTQLVAANKGKYDEYRFERSLATAATASAARATDANSTPDATTTKAQLAATEAKLATTKAQLAAEKESKETFERNAARESAAHTQFAMQLADKFAAVNTETMAAQKESQEKLLASQKEMQEKQLAAQKRGSRGGSRGVERAAGNFHRHSAPNHKQ